MFFGCAALSAVRQTFLWGGGGVWGGCLKPCGSTPYGAVAPPLFLLLAGSGAAKALAEPLVRTHPTGS